MGPDSADFMELSHKKGKFSAFFDHLRESEQMGAKSVETAQNSDPEKDGANRMKPVYRKWVVIPGLFIGAIAIAALLAQTKPEPPKKPPANLDPLVDVTELEQWVENFEISSQGTVRPRTETVLSAEVSGAITSLSPKFTAGGVFEKGEVLLRIDPTNYDVAVKKAEALLKQRQIEYDGASKLRTQGYRAESEYASAAAALAAARAELVSARRNLERTYIRLPYEGMVRSKDSDLGQFVTPGTRLGVAFATDYAEVRLPLTDRDLAFVDMPDTRDISRTGAAEGPGVRLSAVQKGKLKVWDARIVRSEGVVDEKSRVTYAVAQVDDPYSLHREGDPLPMGTFVAASIEGRAAIETLRVPRGAVRGSDELLVVNGDNRLEIRKVDILRADAWYAYIAGGAVAGERVVTSAIEAPTEGMLVRTGEETEEETEEGLESEEQLAAQPVED